jgi:RNA polymerase sigma-70 factor (ECF subfamily)
VEERAIALQTLCQIDAARDRLPVRVREAFLLSQFDGLTYLERTSLWWTSIVAAPAKK